MSSITEPRRQRLSRSCRRTLTESPDEGPAEKREEQNSALLLRLPLKERKRAMLQ